jgi:hypothetical protein
MARTHGRKGRPWERIRKRVIDHAIDAGIPCVKCGQLIDPVGTWPDRHPKSPSADHKVPLSKAPWLANDPDNLRAMHLGCNSSLGNGSHQHVSRTW